MSSEKKLSSEKRLSCEKKLSCEKSYLVRKIYLVGKRYLVCSDKRKKSYTVVIEAKEVRTVKEVIRSDGL